jgi:hypothetical protein
MGIYTDKSKPDGDRSGPLAATLHFVLDFFGGLIGIFVLTESDRRKAGIYIRRRGA